MGRCGAVVLLQFCGLGLCSEVQTIHTAPTVPEYNVVPPPVSLPAVGGIGALPVTSLPGTAMAAAEAAISHTSAPAAPAGSHAIASAAAGSHASSGAGAGSHGSQGAGDSGVAHAYTPSEEGKLCGYFLVNAVAFLTAVYCAVNWFQAKPRLFAWKTISATISIFLAVLTFNTISNAVIYFDISTTEGEKISLFFIFYALLQLAGRLLVDNQLVLSAVGQCCGHMMGFAAIGAFEGVQDILNTKPTYILLACVGFCALLALTSLVGGLVRKKMERFLMKNAGHEKAELWLETVLEAEDDGVCLASGLLLSQLVRYAILGVLEPIKGYPPGKTMKEINSLLMATIMSAICLFISTYLTKRIFNTMPSTLPRARLARLVQGTNAMTTTWCLLFWSQWQYYYFYHQDKMVMKTVLAVLASYGAFPMLTLFSMKCVADNGVEAKALHVVIASIGLFVGLMWEKAFDLALGGVVFADAASALRFSWTPIVVTFVIDIVLGVTWAYLILPKASPQLKDKGGTEALWGKMLEEDVASSEHVSDSENSSE